MLLLGLGTRLSLFVQGLIYIALTVGLILIRRTTAFPGWASTLRSSRSR